ncbi:MAG: hypothetical protein II969_04020 [Anaerolineaceae bacterium]|nr:hypothetical protein [Anaerolineaceae bacterium]
MEYTQLNEADVMTALEIAQDEQGFPKSRYAFVGENLPLEKITDFSSDPISFEEMASAVFADIKQLEGLAVVKNRFSEAYLDISRRLEKGIAELASCAITKTVFEQKGFRFAGLEKLTIPLLYSMLSFHFRKCHAAVQGYAFKNHQAWLQMLEMEMRWHNLAKRLKATEDKIQLIRAGKLNPDSIINKLHADLNREKTPAPKKEENNTPKALPSAQAAAFPMMGEFLREAFPQKETVPAMGSTQRREESQAQETSKIYDSIKARKKAERLERKHAREQQKTAKSNRMDAQGNAAGWDMIFSGMDSLSVTGPAACPGSVACPGERRGTPPERV